MAFPIIYRGIALAGHLHLYTAYCPEAAPAFVAPVIRPVVALLGGKYGLIGARIRSLLDTAYQHGSRVKAIPDRLLHFPVVGKAPKLVRRPGDATVNGNGLLHFVQEFIQRLAVIGKIGSVHLRQLAGVHLAVLTQRRLVCLHMGQAFQHRLYQGIKNQGGAGRVAVLQLADCGGPVLRVFRYLVIFLCHCALP